MSARIVIKLDSLIFAVLFPGKLAMLVLFTDESDIDWLGLNQILQISLRCVWDDLVDKFYRRKLDEALRDGLYRLVFLRPIN